MLLWSLLKGTLIIPSFSPRLEADLSLLLLADLSPLFLAGEEATAALLKCCTSLYRSPGNPLLGSVLQNQNIINLQSV